MTFQASAITSFPARSAQYTPYPPLSFFCPLILLAQRTSQKSTMLEISSSLAGKNNSSVDGSHGSTQPGGLSDPLPSFICSDSTRPDLESRCLFVPLNQLPTPLWAKSPVNDIKNPQVTFIKI